MRSLGGLWRLASLDEPPRSHEDDAYSIVFICDACGMWLKMERKEERGDDVMKNSGIFLNCLRVY